MAAAGRGRRMEVGADRRADTSNVAWAGSWPSWSWRGGGGGGVAVEQIFHRGAKKRG